MSVLGYVGVIENEGVDVLVNVSDGVTRPAGITVVVDIEESTTVKDSVTVISTSSAFPLKIHLPMKIDNPNIQTNKAPSEI